MFVFGTSITYELNIIKNLTDLYLYYKHRSVEMQ